MNPPDTRPDLVRPHELAAHWPELREHLLASPLLSQQWVAHGRAGLVVYDLPDRHGYVADLILLMTEDQMAAAGGVRRLEPFHQALRRGEWSEKTHVIGASTRDGSSTYSWSTRRVEWQVVVPDDERLLDQRDPLRLGAPSTSKYGEVLAYAYHSLVARVKRPAHVPFRHS